MKLGIVGSGMIVRDLLSFIHTVDGIDLIHISVVQNVVKINCKRL